MAINYSITASRGLINWISSKILRNNQPILHRPCTYPHCWCTLHWNRTNWCQKKWPINMTTCIDYLVAILFLISRTWPKIGFNTITTEKRFTYNSCVVNWTTMIIFLKRNKTFQWNKVIRNPRKGTGNIRTSRQGLVLNLGTGTKKQSIVSSISTPVEQSIWPNSNFSVSQWKKSDGKAVDNTDDLVKISQLVVRCWIRSQIPILQLWFFTPYIWNPSATR